MTTIEIKSDTLTPEQERMCDQVAQEYLDDLVLERSPDKGVDMARIERWLDVAYRLYDLPRPARIEVVGSPYAAIQLSRELTGTKDDTFDFCGLGDTGWVSNFDFFHRVGVLSDEEASDTLALRDFGREAWDSILLDECAVIIRRPLSIHVDEQGRLHAADGAAVQWVDGEREYFWHGVGIPERFITNPRSYSSEEFQAISSTEERRALSEILGWDAVAALLGATVVDSWLDRSRQLSYELLSLPRGGRLLRKQSPALQDGSQPYYCEPVHEDLRTAQAARKWQATDWTPEACERDPSLEYGIEA